MFKSRKLVLLFIGAFLMLQPVISNMAYAFLPATTDQIADSCSPNASGALQGHHLSGKKENRDCGEVRISHCQLACAGSYSACGVALLPSETIAVTHSPSILTFNLAEIFLPDQSLLPELLPPKQIA